MNDPTMTPVYAVGDEDPKPIRAQSKRDSMKESLENIFWGFMISGLINWYYISYLLTGNTVFDSIVMTLILTVTSFLRAYTIRRWNNWRQGR